MIDTRCTRKCALLCAHACRTLIGACNLMACPIHLFKAVASKLGFESSPILFFNVPFQLGAAAEPHYQVKRPVIKTERIVGGAVARYRVRITCPTPGAEIYFACDGTDVAATPRYRYLDQESYVVTELTQEAELGVKIRESATRKSTMLNGDLIRVFGSLVADDENTLGSDEISELTSNVLQRMQTGDLKSSMEEVLDSVRKDGNVDASAESVMKLLDADNDKSVSVLELLRGFNPSNIKRRLSLNGRTRPEMTPGEMTPGPKAAKARTISCFATRRGWRDSDIEAGPLGAFVQLLPPSAIAEADEGSDDDGVEVSRMQSTETPDVFNFDELATGGATPPRSKESSMSPEHPALSPRSQQMQGYYSLDVKLRRTGSGLLPDHLVHTKPGIFGKGQSTTGHYLEAQGRRLGSRGSSSSVGDEELDTLGRAIAENNELSPRMEPKLLDDISRPKHLRASMMFHAPTGFRLDDDDFGNNLYDPNLSTNLSQVDEADFE